MKIKIKKSVIRQAVQSTLSGLQRQQLAAKYTDMLRLALGKKQKGGDRRIKKQIRDDYDQKFSYQKGQQMPSDDRIRQQAQKLTTKKAIPVIQSIKAIAKQMLLQMTWDSHSTQIQQIPNQLKNFIKKTGRQLGPGIIDDMIGDDPHITVLYGIQATAKQIGQHFNKKVKIKSRNKIQYFDKNPQHTVAIVRVDSSDLRELHHLLKKNFKNKHKFPIYNPHITIAYLKKGARLPSDNIKPYTWTADKLVFSHKNSGKKILGVKK